MTNSGASPVYPTHTALPTRVPLKFLPMPADATLPETPEVYDPACAATSAENVYEPTVAIETNP